MKPILNLPTCITATTNTVEHTGYSLTPLFATYKPALGLFCFAMLLFICSTNIVVAQPGCEDIVVEQNLCPCGEYVNWSQTHTTWLLYGGDGIILSSYCPVEIAYRYRMCECNHDHVEVEILGLRFNLGYYVEHPGWDGKPVYEYPCRDIFNTLTGETTHAVANKIASLETLAFKTLTKRNFTEAVTNLINEGYPQYVPECNPKPGNPNGPEEQFYLRRGTCRGWCFAQYPSAVYLQEKYNWDITKIPDFLKKLPEEEIVKLNEYLQTEIIPNMPKELGAKFAPITTEESGTFVWTPVNCSNDFCCITTSTLCVDYDANNNMFVKQTMETITSIPETECTNEIVENYCPPGWVGFTIPCQTLCEGDAEISGDATWWPSWESSLLSIEVPTITDLQLTPNPATNNTTISLNLIETGNLNIVLVDINGNEVLAIHNSNAQAGMFTKTFSMEKLATGAYFVKITHKNKIKMEKIIKE